MNPLIAQNFETESPSEMESMKYIAAFASTFMAPEMETTETEESPSLMKRRMIEFRESGLLKVNRVKISAKEKIKVAANKVKARAKQEYEDANILDIDAATCKQALVETCTDITGEFKTAIVGDLTSDDKGLVCVAVITKVVIVTALCIFIKKIFDGPVQSDGREPGSREHIQTDHNAPARKEQTEEEKEKMGKIK
eukprot:226710_1